MKNTLPRKVLVLGSGALKIGEAGEFDYSGSQALKALKEEGIGTVLINPNIATIQTSEAIADRIYLLPILPAFVEKVIVQEAPDAILLTFGGQTALNCGIELYNSGILAKYGVEVLGTPVRAIELTEDRDLFKQELAKLGIKTAKSKAVTTVEEAIVASEEIGFPLIIRSAYALGGLGSGFASNKEEFIALAERALSLSPQLLVEESLKGWKEIEYEVVRDIAANCITVCNMENVDPIGIHTGESIVVAPSQTLSNTEYHLLRKLSIQIIQHFGIVGECNVQFALDPLHEDYRVIEVNARLSRSSALASKATGYPLAHVAAKLALGYTLDKIKNNITKQTVAFFEPALDYCVVKIPRWDLNKFYGVDREIGSSMKSVGEIMAIGKTFEEAIQKGIRMLDIGMNGFVGNPSIQFPDTDDEIKRMLYAPQDNRILMLAHAMQHHYSVEALHTITKIDKWFLSKLYAIHHFYSALKTSVAVLEDFDKENLQASKRMGFSDTQLALLLKEFSQDIESGTEAIRQKRIRLNIVPYVHQVDTLAGEFPAQTNYLYMTYHASEHDIAILTPNQDTIVVLGSGPYRIGSSVEFDWCSVNTVQTIRKAGYKSLIINCNPETVSTDYDISDTLYFEELSLERIRDILDITTYKGIIVSVGGQVPNNLAIALHKHGAKLLGTDALQIDTAENRHQFSATLDKLGILQPQWKELTTLQEMNTFVEQIGFPVLIRPSYVLSGAAMSVVSNKEELKDFLHIAQQISTKYPIVVSEFIEEANEIEVDAVAQKGNILALEISEHIEYAGVHSGDATLRFPTMNVSEGEQQQIISITEKLSTAFAITGPFNIQFLSQKGTIKVIELNLRASRSLPFISKVSGNNLIQLACEAQLGFPCKRVYTHIKHYGVKSPQFSFTRLKGADPILGVEMASTGEVGCIDYSPSLALLESMLSVGYKIPKKGILISSGPLFSKKEIIPSVKRLAIKGYTLFATSGTHTFLKTEGVESILVDFPDEKNTPKNALDILKAHEVDLVINIPKNNSRRELDNDYAIRRMATDLGIPLITNVRLAIAWIDAFLTHPLVEDIPIHALSDFFKK